jgi:hypothetical protein
MSIASAFVEIVSALADGFRVDPLLAASWWLAAVMLAGALVYAWRRLLGP